MTLVVDASVAICWFTREAATPAANGLLRSAEELIAPSLLCVEVANTAWKKLRNGEMTEEQAIAATIEVRRFIRDLAPVERLARDALALAREIGHSVYGCVYLALALQRDAKFVTLDEGFIRALSSTPLGSSVVHLADWRPD